MYTITRIVNSTISPNNERNHVAQQIKQKTLQDTYDELVQEYQTMQASLNKTPEEKALIDCIKAYDTYRERIIKIPYSNVSHITLLNITKTNTFEFVY